MLFRSDASRTLARPLHTIDLSVADDPVARVVDAVASAATEDDGVSTIVVGLPTRLDGSASEQTAAVLQFVAALKARVTIDVVTADERLSSVEAESRLAVRTKGWRERKQKLDAAAAAVILQDYLDKAAGGA